MASMAGEKTAIEAGNKKLCIIIWSRREATTHAVSKIIK